MPEPAMIDLLKVLQYLRKRRDDYAQAARLKITAGQGENGWAGEARDAYQDAIDKLEQVLSGHQRTTEKFAESLMHILNQR